MRTDCSLLLTIALVVFTLPLPLQAQAPPSQVTSSNDTGVKPYAPYGGVRENISLTNGDLNLQIPLVSLPGRKGNSVSLSLVYDSKFWALHGGYDETINVVEYWWGWENMGAGGPTGWRMNLPMISPGPYQFSGYTGCYIGMIVTLSDGSKHSFRNRPACGADVTDSEDNSFLRLDTTDANNIVLHMKDGTRIYFPGIQAMANKIVDSDGNVTTIQNDTSPGTITDTLGRQITFTPTISYKDSNGAPQTITFNGTQVYIAPNFTEPHAQYHPVQVVVHPLPPKYYSMLSSVVLPNSTSYSFEYNTYGELTKITYPTGGYTKYSYTRYVVPWETYADGNESYIDFREVTERRTCAKATSPCDPATEEKITTYTPSILGNQNQYMNVVDADGNLTRHQFAPGGLEGWAARYNATLEIKKWVYQGQLTLLRTVETAYNNLLGASLVSYSLPISVTTTLNDSNQVSRVEYTYDTYSALVFPTGEGEDWGGAVPTTRTIDNPVEVREYHYGIGAPGALSRRTVNTWLKTNNGQDYHSTAIHILDRKASEAIHDGAGTLKAQSQFEYDSYAETTQPSYAVKHEPSFSTSYTTRGNLTASKRWRNTDGSWLETRNLQFDDAGNVLKTRDPGQHTTQFSYADVWGNAACPPPGGNAAAYVTSVTDALGHVTHSTYNSCSGTVASTTDPNNKTTDFLYDAMNRLVRTTLPPDAQGNRGQTDITYSESSLPLTVPLSVTTTTKITPSLNLVSTVKVDGLGNVQKTLLSSDPQGAVYTFTDYDNLGRKWKQWNPTRCDFLSPPYSCSNEPTFGVTEFSYDALGRATKVIPPDGSSSSNNITTAYSGNAVTVTDQAGKQRRTFTDALGRLIEVDEPSPAPATPGTGTATISGTEQSSGGSGPTPGTGSVTISGSEQSAYVEVQVWDCVLWFDGTCQEWGWVSQWQWVYDSGSVGVTVNGQTKYVWYGAGSTGSSIATDLENAINADGAYSVTASANGSVLNLTSKATGSSSNYSLYAYSYTSDPNFSSPSFVGTPSGSTLTGGGPGSGATYDTGNVWVTVNGQQKTVTYGQSSTSATVASALNSAINADSGYPVTSSLSSSMLTLTAKTTGASTNYSLAKGSSTNLPATFSQPSFSISISGSTLTGGVDGGVGTLATPIITTYTYDALGNLTNVLQGGSRPRTFTYNSLSQLLSATNPESGTISYTYDADGNLLTKVSPAPNQTGTATVTTTFTYDQEHRLNQKSYSDTTPQVKYSYDGVAYLGCASALTTVNGIHRRTAMCDGAGQESSSYDALGRVLTDRRTTNSVTKDFSYADNLDGSLWKLTYPNSRVIEYNPTGAGRADWAKDVANGINYATNATYAPQGALASVQNGANLVSTFYYNTRLQPCRISVKSSGSAPNDCTSATVGNVLDFTYAFNLGTANNGNVASIANNRAPNRSQSFTYDELNRIDVASTPQWSLNHDYDIWGNLWQITPVGVPGLCVNIGVKNQFTTTCTGGTTFSYDAPGNLTFDGSLSVTYDAENRIVSTNAGVTYSYDGDGKRVKKSNGKLYWYGTGSDPLEESNLSGTASADFIFFNGKRTARLDLPGGAVHYYFANHLGSTSVVTSSTGVIQDESDYYPFGGERVITDTDSNQYKFTGKERDSESGLDEFGARYYSSQYGRFMIPDWAANPTAVPHAEFGNPQSLNLYTYVKNNPLNSHDPDGHDTQATLDPKATQEAGQVIADVIVGTAKGLWNMFAGTVNLVNSQANAISNLATGQDVAGYVPEAQYSNTTQAVAGTIAPIAVTAQGALSESFAATGATETRGVSAASNARTVQANRAAGNAFRDEVADSLKSAGREVKTEVTKQTPFGARRVDIEVSYNGKPLGGVETKSGNSPYLPSQRAKDAYLKQEGYPVNVVRKPKP